MLETKLIKATVAYAESTYPGKAKFRVATNGTLLTTELMQWFAEHEILFTLSLDGHAELQDMERRTAGDKGSYAQVTAHLDEILKFNPYSVVVSVITPNTVDQMARAAKHLFGLGFRYVMQTLDFTGDWTDSHLGVLKKQYSDLAKYYERELGKGKKIYYAAFDERIKTWAEHPYENGTVCDLGNTQIAIAPSGRIYPCVQLVGQDDSGREDLVIGDINSGFTSVKREKVVQQNYAAKEECKECALDGRCSNFCGCLNWTTTGSIGGVAPMVCEHERLVMPIADRLANRLWKRNNELFRKKFYDPLYPITSYIEDCSQQGIGS